MRIISKFHDYYDSVQAMAYDPTLTFLRMPTKPEEIPLPFKLGMADQFSRNVRYWGRYKNECPFSDEDFFIVFCGRIFPVIRLSFKSGRVIHCYGIEAVDAAMKKNLKKKQFAAYNREKDRDNDFRGYENIPTRAAFEKFFIDAKNVELDAMDYCIQQNPPVAVAVIKRDDGNYNYWTRPRRYDGRVIEVNAKLKDYDFVTVFDPYQAFQSINMFLTNIAVPQKAMPIIGNTLKIETHGFDKKTSFRKEPGKKKRKKK